MGTRKRRRSRSLRADLLASGRPIRPEAAKGLTLRLPNSLGDIGGALERVMRFCGEQGLSPLVANRLEVIFEEVVSNAIRHGFAPGSSQSIEVRLVLSHDAVEMIFEDDGAPFDPTLRALPSSPDDLESAPIGGLGLVLLRRMASAVRYERPSAPRADFSPVNRLVVTVPR